MKRDDALWIVVLSRFNKNSSLTVRIHSEGTGSKLKKLPIQLIEKPAFVLNKGNH